MFGLHNQFPAGVPIYAVARKAVPNGVGHRVVVNGHENAIAELRPNRILKKDLPDHDGLACEEALPQASQLRSRRQAALPSLDRDLVRVGAVVKPVPDSDGLAREERISSLQSFPRLRLPIGLENDADV